MCANALGSGIMIEGLSLPGADATRLQGDEEILVALRRMGLSFWETRHGLYATNPSRTGLLPIHEDCSGIPDLAPFLALISTQARGTSVLTGVRRLAGKECDRLSAALELLERMGATVRLSGDGDSLIVEGASPAQGMAGLRGGITFDPHGDHRMVMLAVLAASIADSPVSVTGSECLSKSWPGFLEAYQSLGGIVS